MHHPRPFHIFLSVLALLASVAMTGCRTMSDSVEAQAYTPASVADLIAFDIENFRGSVELRVDPSLTDVEITAHAHGAWFQNDPEAEAEALRAVTLDSEFDEKDGVSVVRIRTDSSRMQEDHEVALIVRTPRCDGARVRNFGGLVELIGTRGTIDVENIEGHVEVRTNHPLTQDATVLVTDGTVYFQIPPGSTGQYDLAPLAGIARFKNRVGDANAPYSTKTIVKTILEEPTNNVFLRTNRGDLRVMVMDNPESLTRVVRGRTIDYYAGLFLQGSRRYTRNLPDDEPRENPEP